MKMAKGMRSVWPFMPGARNCERPGISLALRYMDDVLWYELVDALGGWAWRVTFGKSDRGLYREPDDRGSELNWYCHCDALNLFCRSKIRMGERPTALSVSLEVFNAFSRSTLPDSIRLWDATSQPTTWLLCTGLAKTSCGARNVTISLLLIILLMN